MKTQSQTSLAVRPASLTGLVLILLFSSPAFFQVNADSVVLQPVADADIEQFSPNANFGFNVTAVSGALGDLIGHEIRRALFRFDLGNIPAGAVVNSATLGLQVVRVPMSPGNSTFDLRRMLQGWSEGGVSWNSRFSAATPWSVPGAAGAADSVGTPSSTVFVGDLGGYVFPSTSSLVADVQAWVNDPAINFGWLLISEDEVSLRTARHFSTRENVGNSPVLSVDFTIPPPRILSQPQSQRVTEGTPVVFSVDADGVATLTFQWQLDGSDISGATNRALLLSSVQTNDAGIYTVIVRNPGGVTNSAPATLTVDPLVIPPPVVNFVTPTNGAKFPAHSDVLLSADASASNGFVSQVEFLVGASVVGVVTNSPFSLVLSNLAAGNYQLTARATDNRGASNTAIVLISAHDPPRVSLTSPGVGQRFPLGTNVHVEASVQTTGTVVSNVEFFEGSTSLGQSGGSPFGFQWVPAQERDYLLTAVATDELGQRATSAPVSIRIYIPEKTRPTVTITTAPPNFARLSSPLVSLAGKASDNVGLDRVEVQLNDGSYAPASGTTSWNTQVVLAAGNNILRVRSVDRAGNVSAVLTRYCTYVARSVLVVQTNGLGIVSPQLNGAQLEIGRLYTLRAIPGVGQLFNGWEGAPSQGALLNFTMRSNLVLTANFVPNLFPTVQGSYSGLVLNTNSPTPESTGLLALQVGGRGDYSGRLTLGGRPYAFAGRFSPNGEAKFSLLRPALRPLAMVIQLDLTNGTDTVQGTVTDGAWISPLLANRNVFNAKTRPVAQAGVRAFALRRTDVQAAPLGTGSATINAAGGAYLVGTISDGRRFSMLAVMAKDRAVPFYLPLSAGAEVLAGWVKFGVNPDPAVSGAVFWSRNGTGGFVLPLEAVPGQP